MDRIHADHGAEVREVAAMHPVDGGARIDGHDEPLSERLIATGDAERKREASDFQEADTADSASRDVEQVRPLGDKQHGRLRCVVDDGTLDDSR